jgi:hypothetical protein
MKFSRRDLGLGAGALALLGTGALGYRQFLGPWYTPTPYDDLLHQIVDRRPAAKLGAVAAKAMPGFDVAKLAAKLRQPGFGLSRRTRDDMAAGRVVEVAGWIVPQSVADYSALAAQFV